MTAPPVSVIIISRGRPEHLKLCLRAVFQLCYHPFEVIVIADQAGLGAVAASGFAGRVKSALFETANVSAARNLGLSLTSGDVVAFLDDDAVPEPGWLFHLAGAFQNPSVDAATGFVRGRNGISFQVRGQTIDRTGTTQPLKTRSNDPVVPTIPAELAISTIGTNCAFRRSVFAEIGGFDPLFDYFLDESDINIRLADAGKKTAIVPLAQVHHGVRASAIRTENRVPISLFQIGRSTAIFLRKHCPPASHTLALSDALAQQRRRLVQLRKKGKCPPPEIDRLIQTMEAGVEAGKKVKLNTAPPVLNIKPPLLKVVSPNMAARHRVISGFLINGKKHRAAAVSEVSAGHIVSLYLFSRTALFHRVRFHPDGYWEQTGGLFGRADRSGPLVQLVSLKGRVGVEEQRIAMLRNPGNFMATKGDAAEI